MNEGDQQFRVVLRGYDTAEVDRVIAGLKRRLTQAEASSADDATSSDEVERVIADLTQRAEAAEQRAQVAESSAVDLELSLHQALAADDSSPVGPTTFAHLGARVGQILELAEEEAKQLREQAQAEAENVRKLADQAAIAQRDEADQYAEQRRRDADAEGSRILADARRAADEERDAAERDAAARRQEGEAIYEQQRADAARAAADFETTLAERREQTTAEFQIHQATTQAQLDALARQVVENRAAAQQEQEAAEAQARRIIHEAEERSESLVREARSTAERVRIDSDRELAAATQRRDSINAQLTNVRQMLATLSGSATGFSVSALAGVEDVTLEVEGHPLGEEPAEAEAEDGAEAEDFIEDVVEAQDGAEAEGNAEIGDSEVIPLLEDDVDDEEREQG